MVNRKYIIENFNGTGYEGYDPTGDTVIILNDEVLENADEYGLYGWE